MARRSSRCQYGQPWVPEPIAAEVGAETRAFVRRARLGVPSGPTSAASQGEGPVAESGAGVAAIFTL